jgi:hypothetical protein
METTRTQREAEVFQTICNWATDIGLVITKKAESDGLLVVENEERDIKNMVIDCEDPILEIQQSVMGVPDGADTSSLYERLLQMNGTLVHGAFILSEDGAQVRFRDTLRLATLDKEELQGTVNALHFGLEEYGDELIELRHGLD